MVKSKTEVVKKEENSVVAFNYGDNAQSGYENQDNADISVPFVNVLQGLSPQVAKPIGQGGVKDAKAGQFFNTVTEEVVDGKIIFIPLVTQRLFVEWVPREKGGGFVSTHKPESDTVKLAKEDAFNRGLKFGEYFVGENNLIETFYVYCLQVVDGGATSMFILSCTSTKISQYKKWMTKLRIFRLPESGQIPPLFAHLTEMNTTYEERTAGSSFNIIFSPANGSIVDSLIDPSSPLIQKAVEMKALVDDGVAKVNHESQGDSAAQENSDDVPF